MFRPFALLAFAVVVAVAACDNDSVSPGDRQSRLEIAPEHAHTAELYLGDTIRLQALRLSAAGAPLVNDTAVRFVWESSDTTVVMIGVDGLAEIVGLGEASVTLRVADRTNPALPSATDTARAVIELAGLPEVIHPGPVLTAFTSASHQCVILMSGQAECRGSNTRGQTGTGVEPTQPVPSWTAVAGDVRFTSISGSFNHTCALATDGRAYCWGANDRGNFGLGRTVPINSPVPIEVGGDHRWLNVHARGHAQTCGITTANIPLCVGHNDFLQVGRLPFSSLDTLLREWGTGHRMTMIRTDDFHTCGLQTDGAVFCSGQAGAMSNTVAGGPATLPNRIGGTVALNTFAIGRWHGCGLDAAGAAHCWGYNESGQLGTGDFEASGSLRPVVGGLTFTRIYALDHTTCAVTPGGETWCWGANNGGALGRSRIDMSSQPIRVNIGLGAHSIDRNGGLGAASACAVDGSSRLVCWRRPFRPVTDVSDDDIPTAAVTTLH